MNNLEKLFVYASIYVQPSTRSSDGTEHSFINLVNLMETLAGSSDITYSKLSSFLGSLESENPQLLSFSENRSTICINRNNFIKHILHFIRANNIEVRLPEESASHVSANNEAANNISVNMVDSLTNNISPHTVSLDGFQERLDMHGTIFDTLAEMQQTEVNESPEIKNYIITCINNFINCPEATSVSIKKIADRRKSKEYGLTCLRILNVIRSLDFLEEEGISIQENRVNNLLHPYKVTLVK